MPTLQVINQHKCIISTDQNTNPQNVLFYDNSSFTDTTTLSQVTELNQVFPVATTSIPLTEITTAQFIYVMPAVGSQVSITIGESSGTPVAIPLVAGKPTYMWVNAQSVSLTVASAPAQVKIVIGG